MKANSSHTNRYRDPGLAEDVQRRPCDKARSKHEYLAIDMKMFNLSNDDSSVHGSLLLRDHIDKFCSYVGIQRQDKTRQVSTVLECGYEGERKKKKL